MKDLDIASKSFGSIVLMVNGWSRMVLAASIFPGVGLRIRRLNSDLSIACCAANIFVLVSATPYMGPYFTSNDVMALARVIISGSPVVVLVVISIGEFEIVPASCWNSISRIFLRSLVEFVAKDPIWVSSRIAIWSSNWALKFSDPG